MKYSTEHGGEEKKRPGRPRKNKMRDPKPRNGIAKSPIFNSRNYIEFSYDKPSIFKKLWGYYKSMAVEKIQIIFRPDEIIIWGEDHHQKSRMRTCINVANVNHYYCEALSDVGMMCSDLEKVMGTIDRSCNDIIFLSRKGYNRKDLRFIITNDIIKIEKIHIVELIGEYPKIENEELFLNDDYTIYFEFPGRYFKKMITDMCSLSDQMTIRQDSIDEPLTFEYITKDKKIKSCDIVRDARTINFQSNLTENDTFRVSVMLDYLKPISSAFLTENIKIMAHEDKSLMSIITIDDGAIEIRILTDIVNYRDI